MAEPVNVCSIGIVELHKSYGYRSVTGWMLKVKTVSVRAPSGCCPMSVRSPTDVRPGAVRCLSELKSALTAFPKKLPSGAPLICDCVSKMC